MNYLKIDIESSQVQAGLTADVSEDILKWHSHSLSAEL